METIYIGIILLCRVMQHFFGKKTSMLITDLRKYVKYGIFSQLVSAAMGLILIVVSGKSLKADSAVVLISVFSGVMLAVSSYCSTFALQTGTMTMSSMFSTAGLLIPCLFGAFLFNHPMSAWQWVGIAMFLAAAYFLTADAKNTRSEFSLKTVVLLICSLLSNGFVMLSQQMFSFYRPEADVSVFSFLSFGTGGVLLFAMLPFMLKSENKSGESGKLPKALYGYGALLALAVFIINQLATEAAAFVSPAVLFSFINGGSTIIATVVAWLCYNEKLTKEKAAGLVIGIISLIIIKAL